MHWRGQRQRSSDPARGIIAAPILTLVATVLLTVCLGTMFVQQLADFYPPIGAIVVFKSGTQSMEFWQIDVAAARHDATGTPITRACVLSPGSMASGGGSLIVEAREMSSPPTYRVHWAGTHTSGGNDNCGEAADLILSRADLQKLANTAGGFGVGPRLIEP